ncbi:hypothetical protein [Actinomadura sp. 7K507]|uniref:hypothetical protein n=1 Tax=Actinomadura sp. 7K507 TaxID=2530365 RepID=UPI001049E876|nr:hypothetical protein [Actinomadura sp. 7K507]TDC97717.1 hypothetical protein E1285_02520 [Actinomadura sp. 7K507]
MAVTDDQLETLRAQLEGRTEEHLRMLDQLDPAEANTGYAMLIGAAFFEAAERRFIRNGKYVPDDEVIDFVAAVRSVNEDTATTLDPSIAERILFAVLDKGDIADIDDDTVLGYEIFLLAAMISDESLSADDLDAFLAEARKTADRWLTL